MSEREERALAATDWLDRATLDREDALAILNSRDSRFNNVAFHCQQTVEKLIKAFLVAHGVGFPRIHDIARLLDEFVRPINAELAARAEFARNLNVYAVAVRYPDSGETIDATAAGSLVEVAEGAWALFEPPIMALVEAQQAADEASPTDAPEPDATDSDE